MHFFFIIYGSILIIILLYQLYTVIWIRNEPKSKQEFQERLLKTYMLFLLAVPFLLFYK